MNHSVCNTNLYSFMLEVIKLKTAFPRFTFSSVPTLTWLSLSRNSHKHLEGCWLTTSGISGGNLKLNLIQEDSRVQKWADNIGLVGCSFKKQGDLHRKLVLSGCKTNISEPLPVRILRVYVEALVRFSRIYCPDGLNITLLSQGYVLETPASMKIVGRHAFQENGTFYCLGLVHRSACGQILLITFSTPCVLFLKILHVSPHPQWGLSGLQMVSLAWRVSLLMAIWMHRRQMPQQQYKHMQKKTQMNTMIPQITDLFHQEIYDTKH